MAVSQEKSDWSEVNKSLKTFFLVDIVVSSSFFNFTFFYCSKECFLSLFLESYVFFVETMFS